MEDLRIGIIGAGRIAHIMSAAYSQIRECQLQAVNDVVRSAAERLATKFNIPIIHDDYRELLSSTEVDAVLESLAHDKDVICIKPLAASLGEAQI